MVVVNEIFYTAVCGLALLDDDCRICTGARLSERRPKLSSHAHGRRGEVRDVRRRESIVAVVMIWSPLLKCSGAAAGTAEPFGDAGASPLLTGELSGSVPGLFAAGLFSISPMLHDTAPRWLTERGAAGLARQPETSKPLAALCCC